MAQVPGSGFFSATATDVPTRNPCHATGTLESKLPVAHVLGECGGVLRSVRDQIGGEHMENLKRENQSLRLQSYLRFVSVGLGWVPCSGPVIPSFRRYDEVGVGNGFCSIIPHCPRPRGSERHFWSYLHKKEIDPSLALCYALLPSDEKSRVLSRPSWSISNGRCDEVRSSFKSCAPETSPLAKDRRSPCVARGCGPHRVGVLFSTTGVHGAAGHRVGGGLTV